MAHLLIVHRIEDWGRWKPAFDGHAEARRAAGLEDVGLWRRHDDRDEVVILFRAKDLERARTFADSDDLKQIMKDAGVVGVPEIRFLDEQELALRRSRTRGETHAPGP